MSITTSQLTLYKECRITPDKAFKVDSIEVYLATLTNTAITDFQYIKHDLELSIKVNKGQAFLAFEDDKGYNYCKIHNGSGASDKPVYYFIVSQKWLSQETIQFNLRMDTINSFLDVLTFTDKTKIIREHRNGYVISSGRCIPRIDFASEGFNPPKYTEGTEEILQHASKNDDWYLIYKNVNVPSDTTELGNPVECILATTYGMEIGGYTGITKSANYKSSPPSYPCLTFAYGDNGDRYLYLNYENSNGELQPYVAYQLGSIVVNPVDSHNVELKSISFNQASGHSGAYVEVILAGIDQTTHNFVNWTQQPNNDNTNNWRGFETTASFGRNLPSYEYILSYSDYLKNDSLLIKWGGGYGTFTLPPLSYYDRTDSRLIKIIKLPYCPSDFINTPSHLTDEWRYDYENYELKLRNTTTKFSYQFSALIRDGSSTATFTPFYMLNGFTKTGNVALWQNKDQRLDPKIYHSEFWTIKMIYDSFTLELPMEQINTSQYSSIYNSFPITFTTSTTINSKFMFEFDNFKTNFGSQDFNKALLVSRNNELPIFNQAYINYIRSGYNYDKKIKTTREATTWAGVGLTALGGAVSGAYFGGGIGATAGALVGLTGGIINAISQTIQAETSFSAKLNALNWQSTQVSATDDVDLMSQVCGNRLRYAVYRPSNRVMSLIQSLFYFYGYGGEYFGVPQVNTRIHFNFLQCEAVFKEEAYNIKSVYLDDIKMKLENGITFLHYTSTASSDNEHWDFNQKYANWEVALFE